ncbi:MAG TPA: TIGR03808 family TAT-translocated repetitive protein [Xanthobacteraceae bacterium]|nr:TIGR03808 family TAT-translocated repetitive protein [Xanthobacteraceae bacterium]
MTLDRRNFLSVSAFAPAFVPMGGTSTASARPAAPAPTALGIEAVHFGVRPNSADDQTRALQYAIDQAAGVRVPLVLRPGSYRAGGLILRPGSQIVGIRGASRLILNREAPLIQSQEADHIGLSGLVLEGPGQRAESRGLVHLVGGRAVRLVDCEIAGAAGHGLVLERIEGEVRGNTISQCGDAGLFSLDACGLLIADNTVRLCGNNGILVWRSEEGDDGTRVIGNRVEEIAAVGGGSGQNGNAINVFRAANVTVADNRIRKVAFSAVRGNAASNLQVIGNNCLACGEVALYAEFGFEGAVIAHNVVDGAAIGVAVTNFNRGGRLAVVQGNVIRRLLAQRPAGTDPEDSAGIGIGVEADTAVIGNIIEGAPTAGIALGWGHYLRDVTVSGNIVRSAGVGIAVSVSRGAGAAVIADNLIADARRGAIVGMELKQPVTGDLAKEDAGRFAQLAISGNRVR